MSSRGLILFKKANDSASKAAQTVAQGRIFDLYAHEDGVTLEGSSTAFAAHSEAGGDWKGWAAYCQENFDFFIVYADDCDVSFDGDEGDVVIGKGTWGVVDGVPDLDDIIVYYDGELYDTLDMTEIDSNNWKACAKIVFGTASADQ